MISYLKSKLHDFSGLRGGIFDCDCACAAAPDYSSTAAASAEAARLGNELGHAQLDEAKRQYDLNKVVADKVVNTQLGIMDETKRQGQDYYDYQTKTFRPLEQRMAEQAGREASDARAEEAAASAAADARRGQTQQANQMMRMGLRYGYSPAKLAAMAGSMAGANSSAVAGAMTGARNNQRNIGWARQMDAAGLGRNLAGASQGAYGLANQSGNSAVANQMAPGNALMSGMAQGNGTIMQGQGMNLQGLSSIMQNQASVYNASQAAQSGGGADLGGLGSLIGAGVKLYSMSDRRLKEDVVLVGRDMATGLNLYEFKYKYCNDETRFRGVMADEVEPYLPEAVIYDDLGFASVNYGMLGIPMVEV